MSFNDRHDRPRLGAADAAVIKAMIDKAAKVKVATMAGVVSPVNYDGDENYYIYESPLEKTEPTNINAHAQAAITCAAISDDPELHWCDCTYNIPGDSRVWKVGSDHKSPASGKIYISHWQKTGDYLVCYVVNDYHINVEVRVWFV